MAKSVNKNKFRFKESDRLFDADHLKADLKVRTVRGGAVTFTAQFAKQFLSICSTVVLARLLTPQDFGLIAMVTAVTGFMVLFKDMGLAMATVQRAEIDNEKISTLFWINVAFSLITFALMSAFAPIIAWYYSEPRLVWITIGLSGGFIFSGLTIQHRALLKRQMRFVSLASIDIGSLILGIGVGIILSLIGAGYWALVFKQLTIALTTAAGSWILCPWYPGRPARISKVRSMLVFGGNLTGFNILNYFARNLDNLLIGRFFGAQQLGFYSRAYSLLLLPLHRVNAPVSAVAVPALSRLADSPQRYRQAYIRILEKIAVVTMPCVAFMIATSDWLVLLVLGPQWIEASRIFSWLAIVAFVQPIANTTGWLFITQDRTQQQLQWGFIGGILAIASIIGGLPWGPVGVAAFYSVSGLCVRAPLLFWFVGRRGPIQARDFYRASFSGACASLCVLLLLLALREWTEISSPLVGVVSGFGITLLLTIMILAILPTGRLLLKDLKDLSVSLFKRSAPSI
jgi:PST family polysaccharide transporter